MSESQFGLSKIIWRAVVGTISELTTVRAQKQFPIIQTIHIRRVRKISDELVNVVFEKIESVKRPVRARLKK